MASPPALVTLATPAERRGRALGRLGLAASLGVVLGPLARGRARRRPRVAVMLGLAGFGYGLFVVPNTHDVMTALPRTRQGLAGSLVALMRATGIVAGANVATAVHAARLAAHGARGLGEAPPAAAALGDALVVAAAIALGGAGLGPLRARAGGWRRRALTPPRRPGYRSDDRRRAGAGAVAARGRPPGRGGT